MTALPFVLLVLLFTGRPLIALGTVLGPMAGPVARNWPEWDGCCISNGIEMLPWGVGSLVLAFSTQWLLPVAWGRWPRLAGWILGLAGWCFCGLLTYGHALE